MVEVSTDSEIAAEDTHFERGLPRMKREWERARRDVVGAAIRKTCKTIDIAVQGESPKWSWDWTEDGDLVEELFQDLCCLIAVNYGKPCCDYEGEEPEQKDDPDRVTVVTEIARMCAAIDAELVRRIPDWKDDSSTAYFIEEQLRELLESRYGLRGFAYYSEGQAS